MSAFYGSFTFFTDPVLRGPSIGCIFACALLGLIGVYVVVKKQSLIGESLSHASYPGAILGAYFSLGLSMHDPGSVGTLLLTGGGAFFFILFGMKVIEHLPRKFPIPQDASLSFVLCSFFATGVTLLSRLQFTDPMIFRSLQVFLFGQAATMNDLHAIFFGALFFLSAALICTIYKELLAATFDRSFAKLAGIPVAFFEWIFSFLLAIAIVAGIRVLGVILVSGMLLAPAIAARQYTHKFSTVLMLATFFGAFSGWVGTWLSFHLTEMFSGDSFRLSFPTGPMIILTASFMTVCSLLFAPEKGLFFRLLRKFVFQMKRLEEDILKWLYRYKEDSKFTISDLKRSFRLPRVFLLLIVRNMQRNDWLIFNNGSWHFTNQGRKRAIKLIRLHRLWELYLVEAFGLGKERVHVSAEEMEHILTPELEEELTRYLGNPTKDPHEQPIPKGEK